ncbi:MAG: hypothetical protein AB1629_05945 [Candidatus Omnitrophota bacterium]
MLSEQEKKEILEDAKSERRRQDFKLAREKVREAISFDEYLAFLDNLQHIFSPFVVSKHKTITKFNKL